MNKNEMTITELQEIIIEANLSGSLEYAYYELENVLNYDLSDSDDLNDLEIDLDNAIEELQEYLHAYYKEIKAVKRAYKWLEYYKNIKLNHLKILWKITNFKILYSDFKRSLGY